jgi:hypothetical protein
MIVLDCCFLFSWLGEDFLAGDSILEGETISIAGWLAMEEAEEEEDLAIEEDSVMMPDSVPDIVMLPAWARLRERPRALNLESDSKDCSRISFWERPDLVGVESVEEIPKP